MKPDASNLSTRRSQFSLTSHSTMPAISDSNESTSTRATPFSNHLEKFNFEGGGSSEFFKSPEAIKILAAPNKFTPTVPKRFHVGKSFEVFMTFADVEQAADLIDPDGKPNFAVLDELQREDHFYLEMTASALVASGGQCFGVLDTRSRVSLISSSLCQRCGLVPYRLSQPILLEDYKGTRKYAKRTATVALEYCGRMGFTQLLIVDTLPSLLVLRTDFLGLADVSLNLADPCKADWSKILRWRAPESYLAQNQAFTEVWRWNPSSCQPERRKLDRNRLSCAHERSTDSTPEPVHLRIVEHVYQDLNSMENTTTFDLGYAPFNDLFYWLVASDKHLTQAHEYYRSAIDDHEVPEGAARSAARVGLVALASEELDEPPASDKGIHTFPRDLHHLFPKGLNITKPLADDVSTDFRYVSFITRTPISNKFRLRVSIRSIFFVALRNNVSSRM
jgi:hypothetical protein